MKTYTHFTSPIRRYPDLIVHRVLREVIAGGCRDDEDWKQSISVPGDALKLVAWPVLDEERETALRTSLETIGDHSSERERTAADAERELMDWRKVEFMVDRAGDEFDGVITSVKDYGFFVELNELFIEGLVHISTPVGRPIRISGAQAQAGGRAPWPPVQARRCDPSSGHSSEIGRVT